MQALHTAMNLSATQQASFALDRNEIPNYAIIFPHAFRCPRCTYGLFMQAFCVGLNSFQLLKTVSARALHTPTS